VFDIKEKMGNFTTRHIPLKEIIFDYYLMFIPHYGNLFSPLFTFIAVIFFTSKMAQQTEFIAILCSGTSFRRIMRPYMVSACILSFISLILNHFILPGDIKRETHFVDKWINDGYNTEEENIHKKIGPNRLLYLETYDNKINTGFRITIEDIVNNKQTYFLSAETMVWDSVRHDWLLRNATERTIISQDRLDTIKNQKPVFKETLVFHKSKHIKLAFVPGDMERYESKIEVMPYFELKEYIINEKKKGSTRTQFFEVEQYKRTSFPFATFILTIIGVCVSSRKVRGGVGLQIALGLLLSCVYIMLMYVFNTIATTLSTSTLIMVWLPNIVFSIVAIYFYRTAQK
jgi:lipopolysaccharide export system permease protein